MSCDVRPQTLDDFVGQRDLRDNLAAFARAARARGEALDHVLFSGPPGLGKTTLAQIVAAEMGVRFHQTSGPVLRKQADVAALLVTLGPRDVLFLDEVHRLRPEVEELFYPAMEDSRISLVVGGRSVMIELVPFTVVGATTRSGMVSRPMRDRFGIQFALVFYDLEELRLIVARAARVLGVPLTDNGVAELAARSRGTPRIAVRLVRRVRDLVESHGSTDPLDSARVDAALRRMHIDRRGLDRADRRYLRFIADGYGEGVVGVDAIAAALGDERDVVEDVVEPYLLQTGLVRRTAQGRTLTREAFDHLRSCDREKMDR